MRVKSSPIAGWTIAILMSVCGVAQLALAQTAAPYRLTLREALQKGLQANLGVLLASAQVEQDEGTRTRSFAAARLPRVSAQTYANVQNRDLRAFGISLPGMPEVVGPFSNYDARIYAQQSLVDLQALHVLKAADRAVDGDKLNYREARELVVRSIADLYLGAQSALARVQAAQARVRDAEALYQLARDRHDAGAATGVDVLRAQVQLANERQVLLAAQNQSRQVLLTLARNLGLDPGAPLEVSEPLTFRPARADTAETLVSTSLTQRADYLSLASQRQQVVEQQLANRARSFPRLSLNGNIGAVGRSIGEVRTTGLIQGQIDFTLFDRDRNGEAQQLAARLRTINDRIADLRRGIEEDLRSALLNLESTSQQVEVAAEGRELARRELTLAQDRFQTGTANNIEVVTAQDEVARAEENYILAVTSHVDAKFALALAMGDAEKDLAALAESD